jgi:hypothetical protein
MPVMVIHGDRDAVVRRINADPTQQFYHERRPTDRYRGPCGVCTRSPDRAQPQASPSNGLAAATLRGAVQHQYWASLERR